MLYKFLISSLFARNWKTNFESRNRFDRHITVYKEWFVKFWVPFRFLVIPVFKRIPPSWSILVNITRNAERYYFFSRKTYPCFPVEMLWFVFSIPHFEVWLTSWISGEGREVARIHYGQLLVKLPFLVTLQCWFAHLIIECLVLTAHAKFINFFKSLIFQNFRDCFDFYSAGLEGEIREMTSSFANMNSY